MNKYMIRGGRELFGEVTVSGAKNAAVAIIPAALLVDGVCRIENIPQISDVTLFFSILEELGAKVRVLNQHAIEIDCHAIHSTRPSYDLARRIRASYYLLGALLGRFGQATVAMPGGCNFGVRPIDQHIKGFEAMGAMVEQSGGYVCADAPKGGLRGGHIYLDIVSVGATMNIILAATLAQGRTIIENAAREPHIVDLANFLNSMGADIRGAGTDTVKVNGVVVEKIRAKTTEGDEIELLEAPRMEEALAFEPQEDVEFEVVYEDDAIIIVNKPAGLVVHPGAGNPDGTLMNGLLWRYPELKEVPRAGIVAIRRALWLWRERSLRRRIWCASFRKEA